MLFVMLVPLYEKLSASFMTHFWARGVHEADLYFLKGTMDQLIFSVICRGYQ
jgi:hypothetical protein